MRITLGTVLLVLVSAHAAGAQTTALQQPATSQPAVVQPAPAERSMAGLASAVLARVGYFTASEQAYKDIYGGGVTYGGELRIVLPPGGRRLALWAEGEYREASGELTFTKEPTKVKVLSGEGGLLFRLSGSRVSPYLGAGAGYYNYEERSEALGVARQGKVGFVGVGGLAIAVTRRLAFDVRAKYSSCKMQPAAFSFDAGGLTGGVGIGIRF
jgi:opacity protein-like surface antigen